MCSCLREYHVHPPLYPPKPSTTTAHAVPANCTPREKRTTSARDISRRARLAPCALRLAHIDNRVPRSGYVFYTARHRIENTPECSPAVLKSCSHKHTEHDDNDGPFHRRLSCAVAVVQRFMQIFAQAIAPKWVERISSGRFCRDDDILSQRTRWRSLALSVCVSVRKCVQTYRRTDVRMY